MTRRRREHTEQQQVEQENEAAVGCLDVLRGASALLARHKAEVAGLLSRRGGRDVESLERLASDLTEVLSTASSSSGSSSQQQGEQAQERAQGEEGMVSGAEAEARRAARGGGAGAVEASGGKRAKAQPPPALKLQQRRAAACGGCDALSIPEVLEHVMSFAKDKELLGQLARVCRLWRRVSECERLSMRVMEQQMPCALLGGKESLHARLGGSARRCLLMYNATMTSGRLMCAYEQLRWCQNLVLLAEIFDANKCLARWRGELHSYSEDDPEDGLGLQMADPVVYDVRPFSPASMDVDTVHDIFTEDKLGAQVYVMDMTTGVTAILYNAWLEHEGDAPEPEREASGRLSYSAGPVPVTSMTYSGPPLQAEIEFELRPSEPFGHDDISTLHTQRDRSWTFGQDVTLLFKGQPSIYGERFVRTRLAEEAMAAKQQGSQ